MCIVVLVKSVVNLVGCGIPYVLLLWSVVWFDVGCHCVRIYIVIGCWCDIIVYMYCVVC